MIQKLYIDQSVINEPQVGLIASRLQLPTEIVSDAGQVYAAVSAAADPVRRGKEVLLLTRNKGAFVKDCPGTRNYTCCGYRILHVGTYCTMDCSYCIMQSYFHPPVLQYFVNHNDMLRELAQLFTQKQITRIGTGEFTDSLIWEFWTDLSSVLIPEFARHSNAVLELKSKTTAVDQFQHLAHARKTILSWSLNAETLIREEERSTASLSARIDAAARCQAWGYPLAFHFDPMVIYNDAEQHYRRTLQQLFSRISPENIAWISLGTFRFPVSLKPIIQKRFPDSKIVYGEFIEGLDGKMRYFKPLRIGLYRHMVGWIREFAPEVTVYLCMEDHETWKNAFGYVPEDRGGLSHILDQSAIRVCGLKK